MDVLLLTQASCNLCDQAEELLERLSMAYPLQLSTLDLASPEGAALALSGGILFPPGLFLDGLPFSYGRLSERRLRRELDRRLVGPSDDERRPPASPDDSDRDDSEAISRR